MSDLKIRDSTMMKRINERHRINCKFSQINLMLKVLDQRVECCDEKEITYEEISKQLKELIEFIDSDTYERIYIECKNDKSL
jgi:hypothetical protein